MLDIVLGGMGRRDSCCHIKGVLKVSSFARTV
jgi:hypothetical protein